MSTRYAHRARTIVATDRAQLAVVALAGLLAKLAIARDVAINGDSGLYIYDAQQLLAGQTIMVDFPSRSPLFEALLAGAIALGDAATPLWSVRAFMIGVSVALGIAIYALARRLFDHRTGLASAALFYVTPFSLVWGVWVKTEQAATLLAILGFLVGLRHLDRERVSHAAMAAVGVTFGLAFLVRRTAIVHAGAFGLFYLWYRLRQADADVMRTLTTAASTAVAAVGTTALAYLVLAAHAGGGLGLAWEIANVHGLALFLSDGQGSLGWIHTPDATTAYVESRPGLIWAICQKCGTNTFQVAAEAAFTSLPATLLALVPLRARLRRFDPLTTDWLLPAVLVGPLLYYAATQRALAPLVAAAGVAVVWSSSPIDWDRYWRPTAVLPLATIAALAAGYLYRDRIMYTTYYQDLFPFVAVLAAAGGLAWLRATDRSVWRVAFALVLVASLPVAGALATPYAAGPTEHWFTTDNVDAYGEDIDARTERGERVFTAQPLYLIHSDAKPLADLSRRYYLFRSWPDSAQTQQLAREIVATLASGDVPYAIHDGNLQEILDESPAIDAALGQYYCPVNAPLYDQTDATLLAHESTGACA